MGEVLSAQTLVLKLQDLAGGLMGQGLGLQGRQLLGQGICVRG